MRITALPILCLALLLSACTATSTPPPKVTSAIVRLDGRDDSPGPLSLFSRIEQVTAAAFGQRRKMLRQSLKSVVPQAEAFLEGLGIKPTARAEELPPADFLAMASALD
mgnify:CR=1 FL=1